MKVSKSRSSFRRVSFLTLLVVLLLLGTCSMTVSAEEEESLDTPEEEEEEQAEEELVEEPVVEEIKKVEEVVKKLEEVAKETIPEPPKIKEVKIDDEKPSTIKAATEPTPAVSEKEPPTPNKVLEKAKDKVTALVDRVKKMDKNDIKKVAAAGLGVWGVSIGVGWLAKGN